MSKLVLEVIDGSNPGRTVKLSGPVEVGTDPAAGLTLEDPALAARHARITPDGDGALVEDLGTEGGTFVDELAVHGSFSARPGDEIRVGLTVLALLTKEQVAGERSEGPGPPPPAEAEGPLRVSETRASFVPEAVMADLAPVEEPPGAVPDGEPESAGERYGPLGTWTDERVKHQTFAAAFGILGSVALVVMVFFID